MHELSIALSIVDIAVEESERRGGAIVHTVHIKLGPLAGVIKEALESAYSIARESSPFGGSRLVIEETQVIIFCSQCQTEQPIESLQRMCCSACDTPGDKVVRGRELEIVAMEIEELNDGHRQTGLETVVRNE